jgi:hypothetical protein
MGSITPHLSIHNISSQSIDLGPGYRFSIKPDCVVCRKEDGIEVTGTNLASVEFFIEFKWSTESDPFHFPKPPKESEKCGEGNQSSAQQSAEASKKPHECLRMPFNQSSRAFGTLGQMGTYVAAQVDSQYRNHTFLVLIVRDYARLMRWDRSGIIFTDPIYYIAEPELVQFFERYDAAPPKVRGSDTSVQPFDGDIPAAVEGRLKPPLLEVSIQNEGLHSNTARYIIGTPVLQPSLPIGRSTRTSIAYDVQREKPVFMKDSWPVFLGDNVMEGQVYQQLNEGNVPNIPCCVDFSEHDDKTDTQRFTSELGPRVGLTTSIPERRHHRLILDTVGEPLETFSSSKQLVRAVRAAIIGMSLKRSASASH